MTYIKLIFTAVFWGGTFIAGKLLSQNVDPYSAAFLRFLIASFFLVFLTIRIEGSLPKLKPDKIFIMFLLGLSGIFFYNLFFFSGLKYIQANQASLIIATNPIFITISSALFFKESLNLIKTVGLCLSFTGALIVISNGNIFDVLNLRLGKGELLIFGCVASWV
ncbi:MAG: DMT family transporter, partial [Thermodesulfobacteriota bacterium]